METGSKQPSKQTHATGYPLSLRTTSRMSWSWKRRIAAMPAAPASRHMARFARVTPPRAKTGILCRQACRRVSRPEVDLRGESRFSNTGATVAKSAPASAARATSPAVWQETTTVRWAGGIALAGSEAEGERAAPRFQIRRTSDGEMSSERRCTPPAPTAKATSVRELINRWVPGSRFPVFRRAFSSTTCTAAPARASSSRAGKSFSRSWM